ncbi:embryonic protein UVS.2-like isoform X2 [Hemicordylus capensis]|uniref:embryonic protein UVS.2-like isoform X2 n=1 Tax=Hemicordylus capensis TaxID=884348 RepID=UPI0023020FDA|nr:embryonic protein UVS.2-like isoform X2 [Hemicordylus capensis]
MGNQETSGTGERDLHQDDIIYRRRRTQRSAMSCSGSCYWPKSEDGLINIPVNISTEFSVEERAAIDEAMQEFMALTCIRFISRTTEHDYLDISAANKCFSYIGKIGGRQQVGLVKYGCTYKGAIQHELSHALGFIHEQVRSDRDKHVKINWEYVAAGEHGNFKKVTSNNLDLPYDYASVMHYGIYDFSYYSGKATIVPIRNTSIPIGQREGLSNLDVKKINKLYSCNYCSTVLPSSSGNFSSDNYPSSYPSNVRCLWLIRIPLEKVKVFLKFQDFDLQYSPNCASDYIRIYDGIDRNSSVLVDRFCGAGQLPAVVASGNMMLVEFVSNKEATVAKGFTASYTHVTCGRTFTAASGTITSPNFPGKYPKNLACVWIISAPVGSRISLTMSSFELEDINGCKYDRLIIRDGGQIGSQVLGPYCGKMKVPAFKSTGSFLQIEFHTDIAFHYSGFKLEYSIISPS